MICYKCGAPIPDDAKVCAVCGTPIENGKKSDNAASEPSDDVSERALKKGAFILAYAAGFIALLSMSAIVFSALYFKSDDTNNSPTAETELEAEPEEIFYNENTSAAIEEIEEIKETETVNEQPSDEPSEEPETEKLPTNTYNGE